MPGICAKNQGSQCGYDKKRRTVEDKAKNLSFVDLSRTLYFIMNKIKSH